MKTLRVFSIEDNQCIFETEVSDNINVSKKSEVHLTLHNGSGYGYYVLWGSTVKEFNFRSSSCPSKNDEIDIFVSTNDS